VNEFTHALVRPPGASFVHALAMMPQPIDGALARRQHAEYVEALRETGITVEALDPQEEFPDSCFMQDPAIVVGGLAILNRMGAPSRFGETDLLKAALATRFETRQLEPPATVEGGDVLNTGGCLYVGETARTNRAGIEQLGLLMRPRGIRVEGVPLRDYLHLLTVVTYVGDGLVVVLEDFAAHPALTGFRKVLVPRAEEYSANTLAIGKYVIVPAGFPRTAERLRDEGYEVLPVPMTEFYKADGGVSCLSLIW
jgi:dimethylargininase